MKKVVLYHKNCADGFGAAWAAYKKFGEEAEYIAVGYEDPVPDNLEGKDILIVDFSYNKETLLEIKEKANSIQIYDHHKSAEKELADLEFAFFDMSRSGAGITWDMLLETPRPKLIDYIEDRDLWNWALPDTHEITMVFECIPFEFSVWDDLATRMEDPEELKAIISQGRALNRYKMSMVDRIAKNAYWIDLKTDTNTYRVPCINSSLFQSEIGNKLAQGNPFAVVWSKKSDGIYACSLRSTPEGEDVSLVAKYFGGGGHRNAAGCTFDNPPGTYINKLIS